MELGPIWRAILRNKSGYILIALQIAVTMAIMVNAVAIIQERINDMGRPSGTDEENIFTLSSTAFVPDTDMQSLIDEDLVMIRGTPGVIDVIATNSFPLRQGGWSMGLQTEPGAGKESIGTAIYFSDEHAIDAFGTRLIEGRNFAPNQVSWQDPDSHTWPQTGIVTRALAEAMFPEEAGSYLGKTVYVNDNEPVTIIGVIDRLQAPWKGWDTVENSMLVPQRRVGEFQRYVIRTEPGYRDQLMPDIEAALAQSNKNRIIQNVQTMTEVRNRSYLGDLAMVKMLAFIMVLLTAITGFGIVGLASFSVSRRTRQIGIRRALGATQPAILRYFMTENFLISSVGILLGTILAISLNMFMVETFAVTPMAWYVIPLAMIVLWLVGQAAVAGPARRASRISPAIATRSG